MHFECCYSKYLLNRQKNKGFRTQQMCGSLYLGHFYVILFLRIVSKWQGTFPHIPGYLPQQHLIIHGKYEYEIKLVYDDQFADLQKLKKENHK